MNPKRKRRKQIDRRKTRRITPLRILGWATLIAFVGLAAFLTIDLARSHNSDNGQAEQQLAPPVATRTGATAVPYTGGGRLWFPVTEIDLGRVPLMREVSRSFDLQNVGDAPLVISEPSVKILQGC
jgi:hypothetical protein